MTNDDWHDPELRCFGALLGGDSGDHFISLQGYPELDDSFLMILNAHSAAIEFAAAAGSGDPAVDAVARYFALRRRAEDSRRVRLSHQRRGSLLLALLRAFLSDGRRTTSSSRTTTTIGETASKLLESTRRALLEAMCASASTAPG